METIVKSGTGKKEVAVTFPFLGGISVNVALILEQMSPATESGVGAEIGMATERTIPDILMTALTEIEGVDGIMTEGTHRRDLRRVDASTTAEMMIVSGLRMAH